MSSNSLIMPLNQQVEKCIIHRFLLSLFAPWRFLSRKPYLKGVQFGDFVDILIKNDDLCRHFGQIPPIEAASDMGRPPEPKPAHRFYPNFQIPTFVTPTENTLEGFFIYCILFLISPPKDCRICRFSRIESSSLLSSARKCDTNRFSRGLWRSFGSSPAVRFYGELGIAMFMSTTLIWSHGFSIASLLFF